MSLCCLLKHVMSSVMWWIQRCACSDAGVTSSVMWWTQRRACSDTGHQLTVLTAHFIHFNINCSAKYVQSTVRGLASLQCSRKLNLEHVHGACLVAALLVCNKSRNVTASHHNAFRQTFNTALVRQWHLRLVIWCSCNCYMINKH